MGHPTGPTPGSVTPAPGGPRPQHLGRRRPERGLTSRHTQAPGEAQPEVEGRRGGSPGQRVPTGESSTAGDQEL